MSQRLEHDTHFTLTAQHTFLSHLVQSFPEVPCPEKICSRDSEKPKENGDGLYRYCTNFKHAAFIKLEQGSL